MNSAIALLPFAGFLFILPFPGTVAFRLLCLAAAFLIAVIAWKRLAPPPIPAKAAILFWALVAAASVFYSFDPSYSAGEWKNEVGYALMAFLAFFAFVRGPREQAALLAALGAAVLVIAVWGTANAMTLGMWHEGGGHGGAGGLSAYFVAIAPLFAVAMVAVRSRRARWTFAVALVLILIAALAGRQRMLWPIFFLQLAIGVGLAQYAGAATLSRRTLIWGLGAAALLAVLAFAGLQAWRMQTGHTRPVAQDVRLAMWPGVADRILEEPLAGAGLGRQAMRKAYPELVREGGNEYFWHAHNVFLNAGVSMGVPGVVALIWLFGAFLWIYARMLGEPDPFARWIGIAGILMILGVIGRNLTNDFFVRDGALMFWALNGALLGAGLRSRRTR